MPADFLSRIPASSEASKDDVIAPFDPFQTDLVELQQEEPSIQKSFFYDKHHRWPDQMSKAEETSLRDFLTRLIRDKNGTIWVRLNNYKYPRTALLLPKKYRKEALCEAHNSIFGGHDANLKTYMKISTSYYWPGLFKDVKNHV